MTLTVDTTNTDDVDIAISEFESAVAGEVCFETVRGWLRVKLGMFVDQLGFIHLGEFVVTMEGGGQ